MGPQSTLFLDLSIFLDFLNILSDFIGGSIDLHDLPNVLKARKTGKQVPEKYVSFRGFGKAHFGKCALVSERRDPSKKNKRASLITKMVLKHLCD